MTVIQLRIDELSEHQLDALVSEADGCAKWVVMPYSTDWQWGGPIIERERISTLFGVNQKQFPGWSATVGPVGYEQEADAHGSTPLIAAMRAYVASKFGDTVELPV